MVEWGKTVFLFRKRYLRRCRYNKHNRAHVAQWHRRDAERQRQGTIGAPRTIRTIRRVGANVLRHRQQSAPVFARMRFIAERLRLASYARTATTATTHTKADGPSIWMPGQRFASDHFKPLPLLPGRSATEIPTPSLTSVYDATLKNRRFLL